MRPPPLCSPPRQFLVKFIFWTAVAALTAPFVISATRAHAVEIDYGIVVPVRVTPGDDVTNLSVITPVEVGYEACETEMAAAGDALRAQELATATALGIADYVPTSAAFCFKNKKQVIFRPQVGVATSACVIASQTGVAIDWLAELAGCP